jgi:hypothetical protein
MWPINITNGPFVRLIPLIYIQNVHLFGMFDPEKHRFQLAQRDYKISQKLPVNFAKTFQTTYTHRHDSNSFGNFRVFSIRIYE